MFPLGLTLIGLGLVALPVVVWLFASFRPAGQLLFTGHTRTTATYAEVVISASTYHLRKNSFLYAPSMPAVSLSVTFTPAWLTERTDVPGRRLLHTLMFVPMPMPSFAVALRWLLLLGPNAGTINNVFLRARLG